MAAVSHEIEWRAIAVPPCPALASLRPPGLRARQRNNEQQRRPGAGLLHHTDQGSQYAARQYRERLAQLGFTASMSRKGNG